MQYILNKIRVFLGDESGASVIEVAVIIVILVLVALVFKDQLEDVLTVVMDKVKATIGTI